MNWEDYDEYFDPCPECNEVEPDWTWDGRCQTCGHMDPDRADYSEDVNDNPSPRDEIAHRLREARRLK